MSHSIPPNNKTSNLPGKKTQPKRQVFLKASCSLLVTVAIAFVGLKIYENRSLFNEWQPTLGDLFCFLGGAVLYAFSKFLIGFAWHKLTVFMGNTDIDLNDNLKIFARTQIAKYIPGNIFHLAGRHAVCKSLGFTHGGLAGAAVYEFVGVITAAGLIAIAGLILWEFRIDQIRLIMLLATIVLAGLAPALLNFLSGRIKFLNDLTVRNKTYGEIFFTLSGIYFLYLLFFIISGVIFYALILLFGGQGFSTPIGPVITIYALSWVIGYITPGASGGMGVREAVIIAFLSGIVGEPASILVALTLRLITIIGDFLVFGFSFLIPYHQTRTIKAQPE